MQSLSLFFSQLLLTRLDLIFPRQKCFILIDQQLAADIIVYMIKSLGDIRLRMPHLLIIVYCTKVLIFQIKFRLSAFVSELASSHMTTFLCVSRKIGASVQDPIYCFLFQ